MRRKCQMKNRRVFKAQNEPPTLAKFLQRRIVTTVYLIAAISSIILFLAAFPLTMRSLQRREFARVVQLERDWSNLVESFGKMLNVLSADTEMFQNEECIGNLLEQIYTNYQPLVAYPAFGRADGKMISYPAFDYGPDYDPRERPWYKAALQNPQSYVFVKPFMHAILNEPAIAVVKAVYDENGELLGVLGLDLITSFIAENLLEDRSYIVDENGQILAKRGAVKAVFDPKSVTGKETFSGLSGLTHYVAKSSIIGTYVVVEHSVLDELVFSLAAAMTVLLVTLILNLFATQRMKNSLKKAVVDPLANIVEATKNYLSGKPFEIDELEEPVYETKMLVNEISDMVMIIESQMQELKASYDQLEDSQRELEEAYEKLKSKEEEIRRAYSILSERLGMVIESFDEATGEHTQRVRKLSRFLAEKLNLPEDLVEQIELYAPLHDVGKIRVPKEILNKPGRLTPEEFEIVKKHVLWGAEILGDEESLRVARNIALYHHERYDGSGYPFGLKDGEIPIEAQIVGLVDVYDALRSERPYKRALSHEEAIQIIVDGDEKTSPSQFSPELLEIFLKHSEEIKKIWEQ